MKKVPYKLLIHTSDYTGNFERELIAYCIGILDEYQKDYAPEYIKCFWNVVICNTINNLEEYEDELNKGQIKILSPKDYILLDKNEIKKKEYEKDIRRLYDMYLCNTYQEVDDWEQETFYNICSFYKNKEYNCDTIFIQLNDILPENLEKIIIERIKNFFKNGVYDIIENYRSLYLFGDTTEKKDYNLLDLELVDENDVLIKKYI